MYAYVFDYRHGEYLANMYPEAKLMTKYSKPLTTYCYKKYVNEVSNVVTLTR